MESVSVSPNSKHNGQGEILARFFPESATADSYANPRWFFSISLVMSFIKANLSSRARMPRFFIRRFFVATDLGAYLALHKIISIRIGKRPKPFLVSSYIYFVFTRASWAHYSHFKVKEGRNSQQHLNSRLPLRGWRTGTFLLPGAIQLFKKVDSHTYAHAQTYANPNTYANT